VLFFCGEAVAAVRVWVSRVSGWDRRRKGQGCLALQSRGEAPGFAGGAPSARPSEASGVGEGVGSRRAERR